MKKKKALKIFGIVVLCVILTVTAIVTTTVSQYLRLTKATDNSKKLPFLNWLTSPEKEFYDEITAIPCEIDELPYTVMYSEIYMGDKKLADLYDLENENKAVHSIFCVYQNRAYFTVDDFNDTLLFKIMSIDLTDRSVQTHCQINDYDFVGYNNRYAYEDYRYCNKNQYYCNGKIVLNDKATVWEYDLYTDTVEKYAYDEYDFPDCEIYGETVDGKTISLTLRNEKRTFTLDEMSKNSSVISKICSYKDKVTQSGRPYLYDIFVENKAQYINGKYYICMECIDRRDHIYAVFLEYDWEKDEWKYAGAFHSPSQFLFEVHDITLIPTVPEKT